MCHWLTEDVAVVLGEPTNKVHGRCGFVGVYPVKKLEYFHFTYYRRNSPIKDFWKNRLVMNLQIVGFQRIRKFCAWYPAVFNEYGLCIVIVWLFNCNYVISPSFSALDRIINVLICNLK